MPQIPLLPANRARYTPELFQFMKDTRDYLRSLAPVQSLDMLTSHTAVGVTRKGAPKAKASAPSSSGMNFRGEWSSGETYGVGDVVVVRGGVSAGAYVAILNVPAGQAPAYPDVGVYWVSLSRDFAGSFA